MKRLTFALGALAVSLCTLSSKPMTPPRGSKPISDKLIGIFFEDISMAADGGLYAELVQNGAFEYNPTERDGWGATTAWRFAHPGHSVGHIEVKQQDPIHPNNPNYVRIHADRIGHFSDYDGWTGIGLQNDGFWGMNVKSGEEYRFSVFARNADDSTKRLRVVLAEETDNGSPVLLACDTIVVNGNEWQKYDCSLIPDKSSKHAMLQILSLDTGVYDIDMVSLMPADTYKGHGMRRDLAETLEALNPKFLRFPGGCVVHGGGDGFWDTYEWKTTIGPKEQRRPLKNPWGYHQSMGIGYEEYFQLCEDMDMEPVPILPCGVSCQGAGIGWSLPEQAQQAAPMDSMPRWAQDALDLIEWANGGIDTPWGKVRADNGHPEPYNLKYLGLGNEEQITPEFEERFKYIYDIVTARYPEITIIGTTGPWSHKGNENYDSAHRIADEIGIPILDEHYYDKRDYFLNQRKYDDYPRDNKSKVYLGEYAAKDCTLLDAIAEALYLIHIERNGDIVVMTSYAPLFANKNNTNWNPDLIYFDNADIMLTPSYYVQKMFGNSSGSYYYGDCIEIADRDGQLQEQSVILDPDKRKLYVKIANATVNAKQAAMDLSRFNIKPEAKMTVLTGAPDARNTFESRPLAPTTSAVKIGKKHNLDIPSYSLTLLEIDLK